MPRKKRTIPQNEGQRKVCRTEEENDDNKDEDTLVISDSENEEEESSVSNMSQRESRWRGRENRSQMQDMTEEEMLDLAMRLSKQEANNAAQRQQLEDDNMRKAIAQSLHVSQSQALEVKPESTSSAAETHQRQDPTTVKTHWRRKLSYPTKCEKSRTVDNEDAAAAESGKDSMQYISALSPMPDLSQRTLSQPSPPSPGLPSVPTTASQECHFIQWKNQDVNAGSPEDEPSQSSSQGQRSPAFLKKCSIRLDTKSTSRASRNLLCTQDSSLSLTCPSRSQLTQEQSSSAQSPVFAKTDPKGSTAFSKDAISCCASKDNFTDERCTPKEEDDTENLKESSSHKQLRKSRNPRQRLSLHGKPQLLHNSVPGDDGDDVQKQEAVQTKHLKDDSSKGSHLNASLDSEPLEAFTSHMFLHLSEDDVDDDDEEEERGVQPSPVFRKEIVLHSGRSRLSPTQPCCSPANAITTKGCSNALGCSTKDSGSQHACLPRESTTKPTCPAKSDQQPECSIQEKPTSDFRESKTEGLVSYYWGVPFCPRGQSPDDYTRVILSQLEVYEKSLKEAQHHLLHKAEWSLPLLPCPAERPFGRRMKRHRALQLRDEKEDEDEELEKKAEEKKKEAVGEERAASPAGSEEGAENGQNETYVVVSSPETQEELVQKSPLRNPRCLMQHGSLDAVGPSSCRKTRPQNISEDQNQQLNECKEGQNENYDVGGTVSQESQASDDNTPELMVTSPAQPPSRGESEVMEVDKEVVAEDEERMEQEQEQAEEWQQQLKESVPPQIQTVECPLCSCHFPVSKIEVHAAYCDGTTEDQEQQSDLSQVVALRKRTRRIPVEDNLQRSENTSEQREKCYKCQRYFTSKDFSHHVEKCLQLTGPRSHQGNGLLSALHQAEQVHLDVDTDGAGPSDIKNKNQGGLRDSSAGNASSPTSSLYFSSSPIKSFTPISEASDCLIDFQQQYSAKSSQRLGRKRKFKR